MDINCVNNCIYQQDGKCMLTEIPAGLTMGVAIDPQADCPYLVPGESITKGLE